MAVLLHMVVAHFLDEYREVWKHQRIALQSLESPYGMVAGQLCHGARPLFRAVIHATLAGLSAQRQVVRFKEFQLERDPPVASLVLASDLEEKLDK